MKSYLTFLKILAPWWLRGALGQVPLLKKLRHWRSLLKALLWIWINGDNTTSSIIYSNCPYEETLKINKIKTLKERREVVLKNLHWKIQDMAFLVHGSRKEKLELPQDIQWNTLRYLLDVRDGWKAQYLLWQDFSIESNIDFNT